VVARLSGSERRDQLLREAIRVFGTNGYDGTTLDEIAEAAGVRKQTLLYYFSSKEELFDACVEELSSFLVAKLELVLEEREQGWDRVESVLRSLMRLADDWPELPNFVREAARRGPHVVQQVADELEPLRKRAILFLERGMEQGQFRTQDPRMLLFTLYTAIVGSLTEAGVLRAMGGGSVRRGVLRRREEELIQFVRNALLPER
jgi:TetR/AcrR family transcriptional regulator